MRTTQDADVHGHGLAGAGLAAAFGIDGAVAACPVVLTMADGVLGAGAVAGAVVEAAALLGGRQIVAHLVYAHGVVDCRPPDSLPFSSVYQSSYCMLVLTAARLLAASQRRHAVA